MAVRPRNLLVPVLALAFLQVGFAGEGHPEGAHLRYQTSYAEAMLEARVRNVPVFFARHKDF